MSQYSFRDGVLFIENVSARDIILESEENPEPVYVYSKAQIISNIRQYKDELERQNVSYTLNFSVKSNRNPEILKIMKEHSCSLTLVSGMELKLALDMGFQPRNIVFNGNGKQKWELELAIQNGVLLNIDSVFNLQQTITACNKLNKNACVLLRVNPNIKVDAHEYNTTGCSGSKFGLDAIELRSVLEILRQENRVQLVGLHCHLGSTITDVSAIAESCKQMVQLFKQLRSKEFQGLKYINLGGGLGIAYYQNIWKTCSWEGVDGNFRSALENLSNECSKDVIGIVVNDFKSNKVSVEEFMSKLRKTCLKSSSAFEALEAIYSAPLKMPSATDLVKSIAPLIDNGIHLILEPGRSLVGNAAVLLCSVVGCKTSGDKNFIVVNGAMTEVIRPSLYGSYHHIEIAEKTSGEKNTFDVVGPVCESGDFLGKNRFLNTPHENCLLAVFDVGAYCSSMSMTYNMRRGSAEVLVDGNDVKIIRRADTYDDLMAPYKI